ERQRRLGDAGTRRQRRRELLQLFRAEKLAHEREQDGSLFDVSDHELRRGGRLAGTNLAGRERLEVAPHIGARAETPNVHLRVEAGEDREHARAIRVRVAPDPAQQLEVESLRAAFGQVWTRAASVPRKPSQHTAVASRARKVEEDHGVRALEALVAVVEGEEVA